MASIKEQPRLISRVVLTNIAAKNSGLGITPLLSGQHGIGKSMIVREAANKLGGKLMTIECSQIGEGVITGLPVASKAADGSTEVTFVKYYTINKIKQLEKHYYDIVTTKGFLGGDLKMDPITGEITYKDCRYPGKTDTDKILDGEDNKYKFGETLPLELKIKLISSTDIQIILLFLDEINRCDQMTQKEMMNIILNRSVNGYDLPWWVSIVAAMNPVSQNSSYAVNEMDPAQLDRFLKIKVHANLDDWIDYALDKGLNNDLVAALAVSSDCFIDKSDKSLQDETEMTPSPRSWEMISNVISNIYGFNDLKINGRNVFEPEEQREVERDLKSLMVGKVGQTAASTIIAAINNKENNIKPQEILTAKEPRLDANVVDKFNRLKSLSKKCISDSVIRYITEHLEEYERNNKSIDPKIKSTYFNFMEQIKAFVLILDSATQLSFAKTIATDNKIVDSHGNSIFPRIGKCFANDVLERFLEFKNELNKVKDND